MSRRERLARAVDSAGISRLVDSWPSWRGLLVLNYHRIADPVTFSCDVTQISATPDSFASHVRTLKTRCEVIGIQDVETALAGKSGRYAMITFDDGYRDNYDHARPILHAEGVAATFFICTGLLDGGELAWWDQIGWLVQHAQTPTLPASRWLAQSLSLSNGHRSQTIGQLASRYKSLPREERQPFLEYLAAALGTPRRIAPPDDARWMTWDMVRDLDAMGMGIGGHTVTHPVLASVAPEEQSWEIAECQRRLTEELGHSVTAFAYPHGGSDAYDQHSVAALSLRGFTHAFTFHGGYARPGDADRFELPRVGIGAGMTPHEFNALLSMPQVFARNWHASRLSHLPQRAAR